MFMVEYFEGIQKILKHGEVNFTLRVVPIKVKAKVVFATPFTGYFVVSLEGEH